MISKTFDCSLRNGFNGLSEPFTVNDVMGCLKTVSYS